MRQFETEMNIHHINTRLTAFYDVDGMNGIHFLEVLDQYGDEVELSAEDELDLQMKIASELEEEHHNQGLYVTGGAL